MTTASVRHYRTEFGIWWLSQSDLEILAAHDWPDPLPPWLVDEVRSAYGRAGRGRLWVSRMLGKVGDASFNDSPLCKHCERCAGIVIRWQDLDVLDELPGIVTDFRLRRA